MKPITIGVGVVAGFVLLVSIFDGFYTVDQGELGVQLRNGAVTGVAQPGFHWQVPLIDSVELVSIRTQRVSYEEMEAYSKDIQAAHFKVTVTYHVDPTKVVEVYTVYGSVAAMADKLIGPTVFNDTKIVFGSFNATTAIAERARLVQEAENSIRNQLADHPLILEAVQVEDIRFSSAFQKSVEDRMLAEVEVTKLRQNLERERVEADIVRTRADAQADKTIAEATATATAIQLRGEAEALAIKAKGDALRDNPGLIALIQAERWDGVLPHTMLPGSTVPFLDVSP